MVGLTVPCLLASFLGVCCRACSPQLNTCTPIATFKRASLQDE